jgi:hypothetical protein
MIVPSTYAHYRFGAQLIPQMPPKVQRTVTRFRQLYDMGLHGPDILFYQSLIPGGKLRDKFHAQTGNVFFERVCRSVRLNPSEGAMAYLYGVLAHYALDSLSHPFIHRMAEKEKLSKDVIITEFDRYLLQMDGKKPPHLQDLSGHMKLTPGECGTVAAFYPRVSAGAVGKSVERMAIVTRMLALPQGNRRQWMDKGAKVLLPRVADRMMPVHPNRSCASINPSLMRLYDMATDRYPLLLEQIHAHLRRKAPLGPDFSVPFG